jgi:hypothetical protein
MRFGMQVVKVLASCFVILGALAYAQTGTTSLRGTVAV